MEIHDGKSDSLHQRSLSHYASIAIIHGNTQIPYLVPWYGPNSTNAILPTC